MKKFDYLKNLPLLEGSRVRMCGPSNTTYVLRGDALHYENTGLHFLDLRVSNSRYELLDDLPKLKDTTPSETFDKWGEWVYDYRKYMGAIGDHLVEYKGGEYWRHTIPKTTTVTGTVEVSHDGKPDFTTWEAS